MEHVFRRALTTSFAVGKSLARGSESRSFVRRGGLRMTIQKKGNYCTPEEAAEKLKSTGRSRTKVRSRHEK